MGVDDSNRKLLSEKKLLKIVGESLSNDFTFFVTFLWSQCLKFEIGRIYETSYFIYVIRLLNCNGIISISSLLLTLSWMVFTVCISLICGVLKKSGLIIFAAKYFLLLVIRYFSKSFCFNTKSFTWTSGKIDVNKMFKPLYFKAISVSQKGVFVTLVNLSKNLWSINCFVEEVFCLGKWDI